MSRKISSKVMVHHKLHEAYNSLERKRRECDTLICASIDRELKIAELKNQIAVLELGKS